MSVPAAERRSVPPPIAQEYLRQNDGPVPRGVPVGAAPAPVAGSTPGQVLRDVAGVTLIGLACAGGVALAWTYAGTPYGAGLLCLLALVAGVVLGRI